MLSPVLALCVGEFDSTQNGRHFQDDIFESIFLNEKLVQFLTKMLLEFVL